MSHINSLAWPLDAKGIVGGYELIHASRTRIRTDLIIKDGIRSVRTVALFDPTRLYCDFRLGITCIITGVITTEFDCYSTVVGSLDI
jgi:hypothetical protein